MRASKGGNRNGQVFNGSACRWRTTAFVAQQYAGSPFARDPPVANALARPGAVRRRKRWCSRGPRASFTRPPPQVRKRPCVCDAHLLAGNGERWWTGCRSGRLQQRRRRCVWWSCDAASVLLGVDVALFLVTRSTRLSWSRRRGQGTRRGVFDRPWLIRAGDPTPPE